MCLDKNEGDSTPPRSFSTHSEANGEDSTAPCSFSTHSEANGEGLTPRRFFLTQRGGPCHLLAEWTYQVRNIFSFIFICTNYAREVPAMLITHFGVTNTTTTTLENEPARSFPRLVASCHHYDHHYLRKRARTLFQGWW